MSTDHNINQDLGWRKRQIALDQKAENARELGLDYEPSMTDWFPPHIKPVHKGVYLVKDLFWNTLYSNWDGKSWSVGSVYLSSAFAALGSDYRHRKSEHQNKNWCGFTEKQT